MKTTWLVYICVYFPDPESKRTIAKFVTGIGTENKMVFWKDGEPAMSFSESTAKDIVWGLSVNGYAAAVVKALKGLELRN